MLEQNATRAFDDDVVYQLVFNMLHIAYRTNGFNYHESAIIFKSIRALVTEYAIQVMNYNGYVLDGFDPENTCNNMETLAQKICDKLDSETYRVADNLNKHIDMNVYAIANSALDTAFHLSVMARTYTFRTY